MSLTIGLLSLGRMILLIQQGQVPADFVIMQLSVLWVSFVLFDVLALRYIYVNTKVHEKVLWGAFLLIMIFSFVAAWVTNKAHDMYGHWKRGTGVVVNMEWEYFQQVLEWRAVDETCWGAGCHPRNSYNVRYRWEDTGRDRCTGFGEDETCTNIFDDKGYYTINRWRILYVASVDGQWLDPDPYYPTLDLTNELGTENCNDSNPHGSESTMFGCQKEGAKESRHYVSTETDEGDVFRCKVDEMEYIDGYRRDDKVIYRDYYYRIDGNRYPCRYLSR